MSSTKILFLCVHNSARSQMAEAYMKKIGGSRFEVHSAGLEPGQLNPLAIEVMKEEGIDISGNNTKDVFEMHRKGFQFDYVITVCDKDASDRCPVFPGVHQKIHWSFPDPSALNGSPAENMAATRIIRDTIKHAVTDLAASL